MHANSEYSPIYAARVNDALNIQSPDTLGEYAKRWLPGVRWWATLTGPTGGGVGVFVQREAVFAR